MFLSLFWKRIHQPMSHSPDHFWPDLLISLCHIILIKVPTFGKLFFKKWSDKCQGIHKRAMSLKTLKQRLFDQSTNLFWIIVRKKSARSGWIQFTKKKRKQYLWSAVYQHKNNPWVRYLYAVDVRYHLDCWFVQACWSSAIETTITTILDCCKCKWLHRWFDIAITNMNADLVQEYQTCIFVGTGLQIWRLVRCNCLRQGQWSDAIVTDMADGPVQM